MSQIYSGIYEGTTLFNWEYNFFWPSVAIIIPDFLKGDCSFDIWLHDTYKKQILKKEKNILSYVFSPLIWSDIPDLVSGILTLFRMGVFGPGREGKRSPSLKSVTHILQSWISHRYTLPKEDPKDI